MKQRKKTEGGEELTELYVCVTRRKEGRKIRSAQSNRLKERHFTHITVYEASALWDKGFLQKRPSTQKEQRGKSTRNVEKAKCVCARFLKVVYRLTALLFMNPESLQNVVPKHDGRKSSPHKVWRPVCVCVWVSSLQGSVEISATKQIGLVINQS